MKKLNSVNEDKFIKKFKEKKDYILVKYDKGKDYVDFSEKNNIENIMAKQTEDLINNKSLDIDLKFYKSSMEEAGETALAMLGLGVCANLAVDIAAINVLNVLVGMVITVEGTRSVIMGINYLKTNKKAKKVVNYKLSKEVIGNKIIASDNKELDSQNKILTL